jgi:hypothetical protein
MLNDALPQPLLVTAYNAAGNPVSGTTVSFTVTSGSGTLSTASVVTDASGRASTNLVLGSTPGTVVVHAASATGTADFTATALPDSLFRSQAPALGDLTDHTSYELGMKFQVSQSGKITTVRYWKAPDESGTHTGRIWSAAGTLLASVTFTGETASGWQEQALSTPLSITPNTTYVVSVNVNQYYVATSSGLASSVANGPISSVADGGNGVFGNPGAFPVNSWQNSNYFRDVGFVPN